MMRNEPPHKIVLTGLPVVEFPNGRVHQLRGFDAVGWQLYREAIASTDHVARVRKGRALLHRCFPNATQDEFDSLGGEQIGFIFHVCSSQPECSQ
jgi:hypothetical protein